MPVKKLCAMVKSFRFFPNFLTWQNTVEKTTQFIWLAPEVFLCVADFFGRR